MTTLFNNFHIWNRIKLLDIVFRYCSKYRETIFSTQQFIDIQHFPGVDIIYLSAKLYNLRLDSTNALIY